MDFNDAKLPREKVFRDPIHGQIIVDNQIILDLINTPEFQRLRRIKQLGTSSFTFHGAEHSRFRRSGSAEGKSAPGRLRCFPRSTERARPGACGKGLLPGKGRGFSALEAESPACRSGSHCA